MRGKVILSFFVRVRGRITPAHAGKSIFYSGGIIGKWDHPRTCGEKQLIEVTLKYYTGSPPHMRGKAKSVGSGKSSRRITPAHAGKSIFTCGYNFTIKDHPRTCGEKLPSASFFRLKNGSPPHMRGKAKPPLAPPPGGGITPAHAGKRGFFALRSLPMRDHPRTCGEKVCSFFSFFPVWGSPPHMRGKAEGCAAVGSDGGITPAHAGKSVACNSAHNAIEDHPRTCGEKSCL